ncbi:hypothetical protein DFJ74DRAFT_475501 [Hyaloraphidium curvatum]|nr:hypothetical protein DFJ74DRAFT_475501 [Hyaloraphidium curvatum]
MSRHGTPVALRTKSRTRSSCTPSVPKTNTRSGSLAASSTPNLAPCCIAVDACNGRSRRHRWSTKKKGMNSEIERTEPPIHRFRSRPRSLPRSSAGHGHRTSRAMMVATGIRIEPSTCVATCTRSTSNSRGLTCPLSPASRKNKSASSTVIGASIWSNLHRSKIDRCLVARNAEMRSAAGSPVSMSIDHCQFCSGGSSNVGNRPRIAMKSSRVRSETEVVPRWRAAMPILVVKRYKSAGISRVANSYGDAPARRSRFPTLAGPRMPRESAPRRDVPVSLASFANATKARESRSSFTVKRTRPMSSSLAASRKACGGRRGPRGRGSRKRGRRPGAPAASCPSPGAREHRPRCRKVRPPFDALNAVFVGVGMKWSQSFFAVGGVLLTDFTC